LKQPTYRSSGPESSYKLDELARHVDGRVEGDGSFVVTGLSSLADAGPTELSFYASPKYAPLLAQTRAGALLTAQTLPGVEHQILVADPFLSMNRLLDLFYPPSPGAAAPPVDPGSRVAASARLAEGVRVMPSAYVGEGSAIGARTVLYPGAYVGRQVQIGEDSVLWPNAAVLDGCLLGSRVILHAGAVVGADGFGYAKRDGRYIKIRHVGIVVIEDDVEIGANAAIDRATLGRTVIHRGAKIDNLVHIGHNVEVGEDTVMAAQCGISGSTVIGKRVMMGGQVGLVDHLRVGDDAILIAQSGVIGDIPPGTVVSGYPARPHREVLRSQAELRSLGRLRAEMRELGRRLARILSPDTDRQG